MTPVLVLDTNVVLDAFVFLDARALALRDALLARAVRWCATHEMREELRRVLNYPLVVKRLALNALPGDSILAHFDALATLHDPAPRAALTCRDPDDQKFIDLAVAQRAQLVSKDRAVLDLRKRLAAFGVTVAPVAISLTPKCAEPLLPQPSC